MLCNILCIRGGLYRSAVRYYDPGTGRWLNRDPAGYGGGVNMYAYCNGNPVNALDPLGLCDQQWYDKAGALAATIDHYLDYVGGNIPVAPGSPAVFPGQVGKQLITGPLHNIAATGHMGEAEGRIAGGEVTLANLMQAHADVGIAVGWCMAAIGPKESEGSGLKGIEAEARGRFYRGAKVGEEPNVTARLKIDIKPNADGIIQPDKGLSVVNNPSKLHPNFSDAYPVQSIPKGLKIIQKGDPWHFEIMPEEPMHHTQFQSLLDQIQLGPKVE